MNEIGINVKPQIDRYKENTKILERIGSIISLYNYMIDSSNSGIDYRVENSNIVIVHYPDIYKCFECEDYVQAPRITYEELIRVETDNVVDWIAMQIEELPCIFSIYVRAKVHGELIAKFIDIGYYKSIDGDVVIDDKQFLDKRFMKKLLEIEQLLDSYKR